MTRLSGPTLIAVGIVLGGSLLLDACGSSSASPTRTAVASGSCTQINAVLSDGPDPDADPVGYAQAQILPLRQISTSNDKLRAAIEDLGAAYKAVVATNNSGASKQQVSAASNQVDALCPGATS